jgi:hypothetical protein
MLQRAMDGVLLAVLMAVRGAGVGGLRQAIRETLRVQNHERDREQDRNLRLPAPHFLQVNMHPLQWSFPANFP